MSRHEHRDANGMTHKRTYHLQQFRHRFTGRSTDVEPVLYPLHAPFDNFRVLAGLETRIVDTEELDGLHVPSLSLINGDNMEDAVVGDAVDGHPYPDGHGGGMLAVDQVESKDVQRGTDFCRRSCRRAAARALLHWPRSECTESDVLRWLRGTSIHLRQFQHRGAHYQTFEH